MKTGLLFAAAALLLAPGALDDAGALAQPETITIVKGKVRNRGWLGVSIRDMSERRARDLECGSEKGALVLEVAEESPAEEAGLRKNDVIVEFGGKKVADAGDLSAAVRKTKPGTETTVVFYRGKDRKTAKASVASPPSLESVFGPGSYLSALDMYPGSPVAGLHLRRLNRQLGEFFGAPGGKGVLVEKVEEDTEGEESGFRAGDVILKADGSPVRDAEDVRAALAEADTALTLEVLRKGASLRLGLRPGEEPLYRGLLPPPPHGRGLLHREFLLQEQDEDCPEEETIRLRMESRRGRLEELRRELGEAGARIRCEVRALKDRLKREVRRAAGGLRHSLGV
ncbi:MAG: PDZ domain-containing protein [Bacteroidota bacterium]